MQLNLMKTISTICALALCLSAVSCADKTVAKINIGKEVANRDAKGHFILPACPECGASATVTTTLYQCDKGHTFHGPITVRK
jgi:hypothetical protein